MPIIVLPTELDVPINVVVLPIALIFIADDQRLRTSLIDPILKPASSPPPAITVDKEAPVPDVVPPVEFAIVITDVVLVVKNPLPPFVITTLTIEPVALVVMLAAPFDEPFENIK